MAAHAEGGALRDDPVIPQGSAWNRAWQITDSAGAALVVTGWSVRAQIRPTSSDPTVLFEWNSTPSPGIGVATATGSSVAVYLTGVDSAQWTFRSGVWDVYLTSPTGIPTRIVEGLPRVSPSVTH